MRRLAVHLVSSLARRVLRRYRPHVVAITGSYGKTAAKQAISAVLGRLYDVRSSAKSFNNELGVPFTVLGVPEFASMTGISRMTYAVAKGIRLLMLSEPYPAVVVLELGSDAPGDIAASLELATPSVGIVTGVGPTHLQRFGSVENVFAEKSLVATSVKKGGWAVLNGDDPRVRTLAEETSAAVVSYGFDDGVAVRCLDAAHAQREDGAYGLMLAVQCCTEKFQLFVPGVTGTQSAYAVLAGIAVGIAFHMDIPDIVEGLSGFDPPPGRMRLIAGVHGSTIIDDTYNSSPDACHSAVEALRQYPADGKRYAVLGEMADLGAAAVPAHRMIGRAIAENGIDALVCVGDAAQAIAAGAFEEGFPKGSAAFAYDASDAAKQLRGRLTSGDVALIKGSQVARMERTVAGLMAEPGSAQALLVRQDTKWLHTP